MKKIKTLLIVLALAIIPLTYGASKNKIRFHDAEFEKLVSEQKFKEASNRLKFLIDQSHKNNDEFLWANLIAKETLLKIGMHGYETAVIDLKKQPQPKNSLAKAVINITLAYSFKTYFDSYSYEIRKREFVSEKNNFDIKKLTTEEIFNESLKAFNLAWNIRQDLGTHERDALNEIISPNNYPDNIRQTLRDSLTYSLATFFSDNSLWSAKEKNEKHLIDQKTFVAGFEKINLTDMDVHPLKKISFVLKDLENWHLSKKNTAAALEARFQRIRIARDHFSNKEDTADLIKELKDILQKNNDISWVTMGHALLAEIIKSTDHPEAKINARQIALQGSTLHPQSLGAKRCRDIIKEIELPTFTIEGMNIDGSNNSSVAVKYQNLTKLYFKSYKIDFKKFIETTKDYSLRPSWRELAHYLNGRANYEWSEELRATKDFNTHQAFITPKEHQPGFYAVMASTSPTMNSGIVRGIQTFISDFTFSTTRDFKSGSFKVRVENGSNGKPISQANVYLYSLDYQKGHQKIESKVTNENGEASLSPGKNSDGQYRSYFIMAEKNNQLIGSKNPIYPISIDGNSYQRSDAFIYTDRSIYRPEQKILWKVVAYSGSEKEANFKVSSNQNVTIELRDGNYQVIDKKTALTNNFGSISGEFSIPKGKLLGNWTLSTNFGGQRTVKVEEYKRPTFLLEFPEIAAEYRLNKETIITGLSKYYFGMPLSNASVKWSIERQTKLPWWCFWGNWNWGNTQAPQIIATGTTKTKDDGTYQIKFTPMADEKLKGDNSSITYNYNIKVDITNEGGETQSANKNIEIGFSSIRATLQLDQEFYTSNQSPKLSIKRTDLRGNGINGNGSWKLTLLKNPKETLKINQLPIPKDLKKLISHEYTHPQDLESNRWNTTYNPDLYLREWINEKEILQKTISLTNDGSGNVDLPSLSSGAYRITYETKDSFGNNFEISREFIVADKKTKLNIPLYVKLQKSSLEPGTKAILLIMSGYKNQEIVFDTFKKGELVKREYLNAEKSASIIEIPIGENDRGGHAFFVRLQNDYQEIKINESLIVPWTNKQLNIQFATFRDKIKPQSQEKWTLNIQPKNGKNVTDEAQEILAYMYDKSLDSFTRHEVPNPLFIFPLNTQGYFSDGEVGPGTEIYTNHYSMGLSYEYRAPMPDRVLFYPNYGIGGPGMRGGGKVFHKSAGLNSAFEGAPVASQRSKMDGDMMDMAQESSAVGGMALAKSEAKTKAAAPEASEQNNESQPKNQIRSNFSETAFWLPHLKTKKDGSVDIEFTVPDSVTSWQVWAHGIGKDLQSGSLNKETQSTKDLMIRPYIPRFLRESDITEIKLVINNSSDKKISGKIQFDILDIDQKISFLKEFNVELGDLKFDLNPQGSVTKIIKLKVPAKPGMYAIKAIATGEKVSDGEIRPIPLLPGRIHLSESKFVTLKNKDQREMNFVELKSTTDTTRINDQLVVTLDGQLFFSVLSALPYLVNYPYQSTEMALNAFVSSGIIHSVFEEFPTIAKMAKDFSTRSTELEGFDQEDPNRKISLEETPWLMESKGSRSGLGASENKDLIKLLDPKMAKITKNKFLGILKNSQTASGGFPWFQGGPPSPDVTLYLLYGFSKALEFKVDVPKPMIQNSWKYLHQHYINELLKLMISHDCCAEFVTFLNYTISQYPSADWTGGVFNEDEKKFMLDYSMKHWKKHSPYMKAYLAMTLKRSKRTNEAKLVWDSVMDSAITTKDQGTHWAQEDRSWLWYNDTIETHAMALRTGSELGNNSETLDGLVQWLFLNKKLNQWKSTRATSEVIYSLTHYLKKTKQLGEKESATVKLGKNQFDFQFDPEKYNGKKNQIVISGEDVEKLEMPIVVSKTTPGHLFASATWHYSTEQMPKKAVGDFLSIERSFFRRSLLNGKYTLSPLKDNDSLEIGDEVEVQLSLTSKHQVGYVHLKDPRASGFEPIANTSSHKWDFGLYWYEEVRDSGTNFFFERLPQGEFTFKYRLRASHAGIFKAAPATLQPLYAPEFAAFSSGREIIIRDKK